MDKYTPNKIPPYTSEDLIDQVHQRPGLWNPEHPTDRIEKLKLWKEVGSAMFRDWDTIKKSVAYDRALQLQKKWRALRDAYMRELRNRTRGVKRRVYLHFERLKFLGGYQGLPPPKIEIENHDDDDEDDNEDQETMAQDTTHDDDQENTHGDPLIEKIVKKKRRAMKHHSKYINYEEDEVPVEMPMFINEMTEESDSDKQFMVSFVPELRKLPPNIKMWARAQIANVMQEAVSAHFNNKQPGRSGNSLRFDVKNPMHSSSD